MTLPFPSTGKSKDEVLAAMRAARDHDVQWQKGRAFSLVYHAGKEVDDLLKEASLLFFSENGLNPTAFPSLRKFETEIVSMAASLLGGDDNAAGTVTSGGTESLLMAVKTARDWARKNRPEIKHPEMILPITAHPAFEKAAEYFGVKTVYIPVWADYRADVDAARKAVTTNTILMIGSAPAYPHGVVDPIRELAAIAQEHGILFHTDACVGGFMLPFVRKLGYPVPDFDLSVSGVTSISADLHKYGYAAKGASVILYKTAELRRHQMFVSINWPGGIYPSPSMGGTRPGAPIAAAWAVMNYLGESGYLELTDLVMKATRRLQDGVNATPGLKVVSNPEMSVFAIGSNPSTGSGLDVYSLADELTKHNWHLDRQQFPPTLHMTVQFGHVGVVDEFLSDLSAAADVVRKPSFEKTANGWLVKIANFLVRILPEAWVTSFMEKASGLLGGGGGLPSKMAPMYGLIGSLPNRGDLKEMVLDLLDGMTRYKK
ncbi:MAG: aspartate aminotransferase family protein [Anaerolineales bacterium]|nr:aspartate aminotransferase family protein [Anaerolineales bacterium]